MSTLVVNDVEEESLGRLQDRAALHGWTLQSEAKAILEAAVAPPPAKLPRRPRDEDEELDSVGQLLKYMAEVWPNVPQG